MKEPQLSCLMIVFYFSVIGSSSLIAYAIFQNIQKSPEVSILFCAGFEL